MSKSKESERNKRIFRNLLKDPNFRKDNEILWEMLNKVSNLLDQSLNDIIKETEGLDDLAEKLADKIKHKRNNLAARDAYWEYLYPIIDKIVSKLGRLTWQIDSLEDTLLKWLNYPLYEKKYPDTRDIFG